MEAWVLLLSSLEARNTEINQSYTDTLINKKKGLLQKLSMSTFKRDSYIGEIFKDLFVVKACLFVFPSSLLLPTTVCLPGIFSSYCNMNCRANLL